MIKSERKVFEKALNIPFKDEMALMQWLNKNLIGTVSVDTAVLIIQGKAVFAVLEGYRYTRGNKSEHFLLMQTPFGDKSGSLAYPTYGFGFVELCNEHPEDYILAWESEFPDLGFTRKVWVVDEISKVNVLMKHVE